jgi:hypothetical protein
MKKLSASLAAVILAAAAASAGADVLVLRGGTQIPITGPVLQQGQNILVTRADGTLLSVPSTEVDLKATAAANATRVSAAPAPAVTAAPETPAEAARIARGPKARVRISDADVAHQMEAVSSGRPDEAKAVAPAAAVGRVELAEYHQQKSGDQLIVHGTLRNPGTQTVNGVKLNVTALDENGKVLTAAPATVAGSSVDPGRTLAFTATLPVGEILVPILRFSPQWIPPPPPADKATVAAAAAAAKDNEAKPAAASPSTTENRPAAPQPTPYGRGMLYAAPAASAPTTAPADGKTGYIPGASSPENQPQPPK